MTCLMAAGSSERNTPHHPPDEDSGTPTLPLMDCEIAHDIFWHHRTGKAPAAPPPPPPPAGSPSAPVLPGHAKGWILPSAEAGRDLVSLHGLTVTGAPSSVFCKFLPCLLACVLIDSLLPGCRP